ncbi:MAG: hypothetical protein AMJ43_04440 [Coxiella sp. DG_40]|nr:MAG: hypothetical protein AMJ43_04440 [Coxiella sp. DG_40]
MNSSWQDKGITAVDMAEYYLYTEENVKPLIQKYGLKIDAGMLAYYLNDEAIGWAIGDEILYNQFPTNEDEQNLINQLKTRTAALLEGIKILRNYGHNTMILFNQDNPGIYNNLNIYKTIDEAEKNLIKLKKHIIIAQSNTKNRIAHRILNAAGQERYLIDSAGGIIEQRFNKDGHIITTITYANPLENPKEVAKQPVDQVDKYITKDKAYDHVISCELSQKHMRHKKPKGNQRLLFWHTFIKHLVYIYELYTDKQARKNIHHNRLNEIYYGDFFDFVNDILNIFKTEQPNNIDVRIWKSFLKQPKSLGKLIIRVLNSLKSNQ